MQQGTAAAKYSFTTRNKVRELALTKEGDLGDVKWYVFVDDALVCKETMEGTNECTLSFKVAVQGMQQPLESFITIEKVSGAWQYNLCVQQSFVKPWWTAENGDNLDGHPPEVVGGQNQNSAADDQGASAFGATWEDSNSHQIEIQGDNRQPQAANQRSQQSRAWWACCAPEPEAPGRPRSAVLRAKAQPLHPTASAICAPSSEGFADRPVAKTLKQGSMQCRSWAEEVFAE